MTFNELMKELEKPIVLNNPEMADVVIIEGMFFLRLLSDLLETFGFVRSILRKLCFSSFLLRKCSFSISSTIYLKHLDLLVDPY